MGPEILLAWTVAKANRYEAEEAENPLTTREMYAVRKTRSVKDIAHSVTAKVNSAMEKLARS